MDWEEVKHIHTGRNKGRDFPRSQGVRSDDLEKTFMFGMGNGKRGRVGVEEEMDGRGDGDNRSASSTAEGSSTRQGDRVGWKDVVRVVTRGRLRPDGTR